MPRIAGRQPPVINPALQDGCLFIDKLLQLGLQEAADMWGTGQDFIREQPRFTGKFARGFKFAPDV